MSNEQQQAQDEITLFTNAYIAHINAINEYLPRIKNIEYTANTNTTKIYGHTVVQELKVNGTNVSLAGHNHDSSYAALGHTHTTDEIEQEYEEEEEYQEEEDDGEGGTVTVTKTRTITKTRALDDVLDEKADVGHNHDSVYAALNHNHDPP